MLAVTQMNGKHITPRIRAQEAQSDVTYDLLEETVAAESRLGPGVGRRSEAAGRGRHWEGWACSRAPLWWRCNRGFCQTHRIIHVT